MFIKDYEKLTASRGYGKESLFRYQLTRNRLAEFITSEYKTSDIPLADINKRFLDRLYLWLCSDKKLANNTATKFIHRCSSIYKVAIDNGWVKANPFAQLKLHLDKVDRGYLTKAEHADVARRGGSVAREAREKLELETGKNVVTSLNAKSIHKQIESDTEDNTNDD